MKILAVILSFLLFTQSFAMCKGTVDRYESLFNKIEMCEVNNEINTPSCTQKSCCDTSKNDDSSKKTSSKGCCGDDCRCFCSVKVFNTVLHTFKFPETKEEKYSNKVVLPLTVNSFDYHPSISYPPQV